jgi:hypothetical protein
MKSKITLAASIMVLAVTAVVNQARADGDAPTRPATVAEKSFYGNVVKTIEAALPAAPANWSLITKPSTEPPKEVYENGSYRVKYTGSWLKSAKPDPSAGMKSLEMNSKAMQEAMEQLMKASQSGDKAAYAAAEAKMKAAMGGSTQTLASASQKQAPESSPAGDSCLQVEVTINDTSIGLKKATPLNVQGAARAFLLDDGNKSNEDCPHGQGVVLLGPWGNPDRPSEYTYFRTSLRKEIPFPKVENMTIKVRASQQRVNEYFNSIKWDKLNSLLAK